MNVAAADSIVVMGSSVPFLCDIALLRSKLVLVTILSSLSSNWPVSGCEPDGR